MKVSLKAPLLAKSNFMKNKTLLTTLTLASVFCTNAFAQIQLSGELTQGGLMIGKTQADSVVKLNDKVLPVTKQGNFVFGFGRDDANTYTLSVVQPNGEKEIKTLTPKKRKYNEQRIEGIKKSIMKPNPKAVERAAKDSKQVKAARTIFSDTTAFANGFIAPIEGTITGVYGSRRIYNGVPKYPHYGLDYAGKTGDPVKAPADGKVLLWVPDMFYSGGTMIIDHGHGVSSTFLHLSKSYVKAGDTVKQGDVVAGVGASGRATGPHLDWRINWFDVKIDPALVLKISQ